MAEDLYGLLHPHQVEPSMLRRLTDDEALAVLRMGRVQLASRLMDLQLLGMAIHEAQDGTHWVGYTDPGMSNHDRWLAVGDPRHESEHWRLVRTEWHAATGIFSHLVHVTVVTQQAQMDRSYAESVNDLRILQGKATGELYQLSTYMNVFDTIDPSCIAGLGDWDLTELHEFVHHYPAWVVEHPEAGELPRELVWRMHGLQDFLPLLTQLND